MDESVGVSALGRSLALGEGQGRAAPEEVCSCEPSAASALAAREGAPGPEGVWAVHRGMHSTCLHEK